MSSAEGIVSVPVVYKAFGFTLGWPPHGASRGGGLSGGRGKEAQHGGQAARVKGRGADAFPGAQLLL